MARLALAEASARASALPVPGGNLVDLWTTLGRPSGVGSSRHISTGWSHGRARTSRRSRCSSQRHPPTGVAHSHTPVHGGPHPAAGVEEKRVASPRPNSNALSSLSTAQLEPHQGFPQFRISTHARPALFIGAAFAARRAKTHTSARSPACRSARTLPALLRRLRGCRIRPGRRLRRVRRRASRGLSHAQIGREDSRARRLAALEVGADDPAVGTRATTIQKR